MAVRILPSAGPSGLTAAPGGWVGSESQAGAGGDHRRPSAVDGVDDLGGVDALQIGAGHPEVRVTELALDDRQRHPLPGHLHRMGVTQLMRSKAPPDVRARGEAPQLAPRTGR